MLIKNYKHARSAVLFILILTVLLLFSGCSGTGKSAEPPPERAGATAFKEYYTRQAETDTAHDYSRMDLTALDAIASGTADTGVDTNDLSITVLGALISGNTAEIILRVTAKKLETVLYDNGIQALSNYRFGDESAMLGIVSLGRQFHTIDQIYTYSDTDGSLSSNQFDLHYWIITPEPLEQDVLTIPLTDFGYYSSNATFKTLYNGNWNVDIALDPASDSSRKISVGKEITVGDFSFTVDSIQITPLACTVQMVCAEDEMTATEHMDKIINACADGRKTIALTLSDGMVLDSSRLNIGSGLAQDDPYSASWMISFYGPIAVEDMVSLSLYGFDFSLIE